MDQEWFKAGCKVGCWNQFLQGMIDNQIRSIDGLSAHESFLHCFVK